MTGTIDGKVMPIMDIPSGGRLVRKTPRTIERPKGADLYRINKHRVKFFRYCGSKSLIRGKKEVMIGNHTYGVIPPYTTSLSAAVVHKNDYNVIYEVTAFSRSRIAHKAIEPKAQNELPVASQFVSIDSIADDCLALYTSNSSGPKCDMFSIYRKSDAGSYCALIEGRKISFSDPKIYPSFEQMGKALVNMIKNEEGPVKLAVAPSIRESALFEAISGYGIDLRKVK